MEGGREGMKDFHMKKKNLSISALLNFDKITEYFCNRRRKQKKPRALQNRAAPVSRALTIQPRQFLFQDCCSMCDAELGLGTHWVPCRTLGASSLYPALPAPSRLLLWRSLTLGPLLTTSTQKQRAAEQ